jgi:hypothetical protein
MTRIPSLKAKSLPRTENFSASGYNLLQQGVSSTAGNTEWLKAYGYSSIFYRNLNFLRLFMRITGLICDSLDQMQSTVTTPDRAKVENSSPYNPVGDKE